MCGDIKKSTISTELAKGNKITYFTVGTSMKPLLTERKTHVTIEPLTEANKNDLILYIRKNDSQVLHRCIKKDDEHYYMRGDNTYGLEPINKAQAIGKVTHIYRKRKCTDIRRNNMYKLYIIVWNALYPLRLLIWKFKELLRRMLK